MTKAKEVTIYDIAGKLNLSAATVSRALNGHASVSTATKTRIFQMAEEMGYRSNKFASNLRRQRSNTIGVIVPRLNSYFMSMALSGMEKVANDAGYNMLISQSLESVNKEISNTRTMFDSRVDGLLVSLAYDTQDVSHFDAFFRRKIPIIFFDRVVEHEQSTCVVIDNYKAGYEATSHLIEQGCKKIIHLTGSLLRNVYADRLRGYKQALSDHNIPFQEDWVMITDLSEESGVELAEKIVKMKSRPDGIFAANDTCAASCLQTLKQANIDIPNEIAVVGFNNDPVSRMIEPNLTTINYPAKEIGKVAVTNLISHLDGTSDIHSTNTIILRSELIVRESSQKKCDKQQ